MAAIFVLATGLALFLDLHALNYLERHAYDMRMGIYAARNESLADWAREQIVLVSLSDETFARLPGPGTPPAPRGCHAKVIAELMRAGAKVIAFDFIFDREDEDDAALAAAAASCGRVVWGSLYETGLAGGERVALPNTTLLRGCPRYGHVNFPQDHDHPTLDRLRPVRDYRDARIPAFSLVTATLALDLGGAPIEATPTGWRVGSMTLDTDAQDSIQISYFGPPGETFPAVPYEQVHDGAVDDEFYRSNQFFRDKIILIGDTSTAGQDHHFTPMGLMSGVELQANAIATILQGGSIRAAPRWANLVATCLLGGLVCVCAGLCRVRRGLLVIVGILAICFLTNIWLFVEQRVWLHLAAPLLASLLAAGGILAERGLTEERGKNQARRLLARYVSPQVAEHIIADPDAYALGGTKAMATILFSDIRGFTSVAEKMDPEEVVSYLNDYFQAMTDVIFAHGGAVDKYAGDGIMAVFGVPVRHPDHARRAVATAIDMKAALDTLQSRWAAQALPVSDIGIGINTGEVVVGNIGSTQRTDFTVIGDPVNLASRVEGLTKVLSRRILITEHTYEGVRGDVTVRGPFAARVEGREDGAVVYELLGWAEPCCSPRRQGEILARGPH